MSDNISYTPEEVAQILKISRFTVYEMIKRGELAAYRIGRKVRVEEKDLEHYKTQFKQNVKACPPSLTQSMLNTAPSVAKTQDSLILCGQDIVLDILTRKLEEQLPNYRVLRRYVGSMDGLLALYRGTANLATAHLWDGDSGDYNTPYVRRMLPGQPTLIYNLVHRMEGFYVQKGNPQALAGWNDLSRPELRLVNREPGSGARVLLDEQLRKLGIGAEQVNGYTREETSHLAVASQIGRGEADFGLGIEKVASQIAGVDFIPLHQERYDLVFRKEDAALPHFQVLLSILNSPDFQTEIGSMGGYDVSQMGRLMAAV